MKKMIVLTTIQVLWTVLLIECDALGVDSCPAEQQEAWSYRGRNGPSNWGEKYPLCYGKEQSPVDISTANAVLDADLDKLKLNNYDVPLTEAVLNNNGHTVHVEPTDGVKRSIVIGKPPKEYTLRQFHFHWGDAYFRGSEHTLDNKQYAMELHFVHQSEDSEIAVVGVIFQEELAVNREMEKIVETLKNIKYKDTEFELKETNISLECFVPENPISYYRYKGSLTTPDCSQNVIWSVAKGVITIGTKQMNEFRKLRTASAEEDSSPRNKNCALVNNYRPLQMLNGRTIYTSV